MDISNLAFAAPPAALAGYFFWQNVRLRRTLSIYTSRDLAREAPEIQVSGDLESMTFMFLDIGGFTGSCEKYRAPDISRMLNSFFTMVQKNIKGGKVIKYLGDAVLVAFDDADSAIRSASFLSRRLCNIGQIGKTIFSASGGLHRGLAYVGTVGTDARADFTAIGDTVNLASRIQSLSKIYNEPVLLSGEVVRSSQTQGLFCLDCVRVKGRRAAIDLYSFPKFLSEPYHYGLSQYRSGRFNDALKTFEMLCNTDSDPAFSMWLSRCRSLISSPPARWDGVYTFSEK